MGTDVCPLLATESKFCLRNMNEDEAVTVTATTSHKGKPVGSEANGN